jgi:Tol biopolymer transport system component
LTTGTNSEPSLSPDGRWVIYNAIRDGKTTLWRMSIDGGDPTQITEISTSFSQVSPDSNYIALMGSSPTRLLIVPFGGGEPLKSFAVPQGSRVRWTPDGKAILYPNAVQGLWRQALNQEKPQFVKGFEELPVRRLAWSFDGKDLAYTTGQASQEIILIENFK